MQAVHFSPGLIQMNRIKDLPGHSIKKKLQVLNLIFDTEHRIQG